MSRRGPSDDAARHQGSSTRIIAGDIRDAGVLRAAVRGVHIVFHLAAMKSIAECEARPAEAIATNVIATRELLEAARDQPTLERFIAVSSDKASNPSSVYGLTKAYVERIVGEVQLSSRADISAARCGSIWGSAGSVMSEWRRAGRNGEEIPVTDLDMTRFVMRREEAVALILQCAARRMRGSVLTRVMRSYGLKDLAELVAKRYGVSLRVIGRRPGEKLHEDLISPTEGRFTQRSGDFFEISFDHIGPGTAPFSSLDARKLSTLELKQLVGAEDL